MLEVHDYAVLAPIAAVAGFIRGFSGFGGPLILLPIFGLYMKPAEAAWVMMWVDILVNLRLVPETRRDARIDILVPLTAGTVLAMPAGLWLLTTIDPVLMRRILCVAILVAALILMTGWRYRGDAGRAAWLGIGGICGVVMGATSLGVTGVLFLNGGKLPVAAARGTFIVWVFLTTLAFLAMLAVLKSSAGAAQTLTPILVFAPLYLAGAALGSRQQRKADEALVRRLVLMLVVVIALVGLVLS